MAVKKKTTGKPAAQKQPARQTAAVATSKDKSLEAWIWDAACSIRGAKDAPKYKDFILPLIFTKRLCDVYDDELNRIAAEVGSRKKAFQLARRDHKLVRFYLPLVPDDPEAPVWSIIRKLADRIGEQLTTHLREIAKENPLLNGIIDRVDFNATTHGQRDIDDDRLSNLEQVEAGMAWHYKKYQREQSPSDRIEYSDAELEARRQKIGLWSDPNAIPPWDYRQAERDRRKSMEPFVGKSTVRDSQ